MLEIKISGDIVPFNSGEGTFSIDNLQKQLDGLQIKEGDDLVVGINTYGGDVDAGFSMYNIIRRFASEKKVTITTRLDGYCASIGTVILLAGDKRVGNEYSSPFVHNAWTFVMGDAEELKKVYLDLEATSDRIAKFYSEKASISFETAKQLMKDETWIEPKMALQYGFFTELENTKAPSKAFYNLLKENNYLRINNLNNNNMQNNNNDKPADLITKISNLLKKYSGTKNKIVFDANNDEVDFYELADGDIEKVGDKANYNGSPAQGDILMADGKTYKFDKGVLTEIVEVQTANNELETLKQENEILKEKIATLEASNSAVANKLSNAENILNELKNLESNFNVIDKKDKPNLNDNESRFINAINKIK